MRKHRSMLFRPRYGVVGMVSLPFHFHIEALGAISESLGYLLIPFSFVGGLISPSLLGLFILLGLTYGGFLSVGAVLLEEMTYRRYPKSKDLLVLLAYAMLENVGYRQLILFFRVQGILRFLAGSQRWEKVKHDGQSLTSGPAELTPAAVPGSAGK